MSEFDPRFLERRPSTDPSLNITFDDGTARDHSIFSNGGTMNNGAAVIAGNRFVTLDGTNDDVSVPDSPQNDLGSAFSICLWFQPSSPGVVVRPLVGKWNSGASRRSFLLQADYSAVSRFGCLVDSVGTGSGPTTCLYYFAATMPTSGWHFVAWTYDSSRSAGLRHKLNLDGVWISPSTLATDNAVSPLVTTDQLFIGQPGNNGAYWKGDIDNVTVFNRLISDAEIATIYHQGRP